MMMMVGAMMIVAMVMMMIVVMLVSFLFLQKFRLDVEDAVEIEGVAAEHVGDVDLRALGAVQRGVRIDGADARLELGAIPPARPGRSC